MTVKKQDVLKEIGVRMFVRTIEIQMVAVIRSHIQYIISEEDSPEYHKISSVFEIT